MLLAGSLAIQVTAARSEFDAYQTATATVQILAADAQQCTEVAGFIIPSTTAGLQTAGATTGSSTASGNPFPTKSKSSSSSDRVAAGWLGVGLLLAVSRLLF